MKIILLILGYTFLAISTLSTIIILPLIMALSIREKFWDIINCNDLPYALIILVFCILPGVLGFVFLIVKKFIEKTNRRKLLKCYGTLLLCQILCFTFVSIFKPNFGGCNYEEKKGLNPEEYKNLDNIFNSK